MDKTFGNFSLNLYYFLIAKALVCFGYEDLVEKSWELKKPRLTPNFEFFNLDLAAYAVLGLTLLFYCIFISNSYFYSDLCYTAVYGLLLLLGLDLFNYL